MCVKSNEQTMKRGPQWKINGGGGGGGVFEAGTVNGPSETGTATVAAAHWSPWRSEGSVETKTTDLLRYEKRRHGFS